MTGIVTIILVLIVIGFCLWLLLRFVPLAEPFKQVVIAIVVILLVLWILGYLGLVHVPAKLR